MELKFCETVPTHVAFQCLLLFRERIRVANIWSPGALKRMVLYYKYRCSFVAMLLK